MIPVPNAGSLQSSSSCQELLKKLEREGIALGANQTEHSRKRKTGSAFASFDRYQNHRLKDGAGPAWYRLILNVVA
jgi:hypothetical protein